MYRYLLFTFLALFSLAWHSQALAVESIVSAESGRACQLVNHQVHAWQTRVACTTKSNAPLTPPVNQKLEANASAELPDNCVEGLLPPFSVQANTSAVGIVLNYLVYHQTQLVRPISFTRCFFIRPPPAR